MAVTALYVPHGIVSSSPSFFLSQITNIRPSPQIRVQKGIPAGLPGARFIYNLNQSPDFTFDTTQVATALGIGLGVATLSAGTTDLFFAATTDHASRAGGSTAIRLRAAHACYVPMTLTASNDAPATMSARIACTYDGSNEPIVSAGSTALSGTPSHLENFVVGPASLNGVAINGIQDISVDFGVSTIEQRGDGELYLTWFCEKECLPVITIRTTSNPWVTYGLNGVALTSMSVYLRNCAATARVANATETHILFSATSGLFHISDTSHGGPNEPGITTIRAELAMPDATTRPLLVDTTAAIA